MKLQYCETGILYNATRIFSINTARIVKIYGMSYIINDAFFEKKKYSYKMLCYFEFIDKATPI